MAKMFSNIFRNSESDSTSAARETTVDPVEYRVLQLEKRVKMLELQLEQMQETLTNFAKGNANTAHVFKEADAGMRLSSFASEVDGTSLSPLEDGENVRQDGRPSGEQSLYLSAPTPEGAFTQVSPVELTGKSIYRLTTDNGVNGLFVMLSTPDAIATAMISVSQMVKPVCRIEGNVAMMPRRVTTVCAGHAMFSDGQWRMTDKATIRFE